jgi:hypothetical protein
MGVSLIELWMPILLGTLLAWISSALIHMLLKYHNSDYKQLANENEVAAAVGKSSPSPGIYSMPYCVDMSKMNDPDMQARFKSGPIAFVTVFQNGMPAMGRLVGQQIIYFLIGCILIGYCATLAVPAGADFMTVFRFVAAVAFLAFGWAVVPFSIWFGHLWSTCAKYLLDALIYGLIVGAVFAWLWPAGV